VALNYFSPGGLTVGIEINLLKREMASSMCALKFPYKYYLFRL